MSSYTCQISGENFTVSEFEQSLRDKLGVGDQLPKYTSKYRFRELGAFWPHWNLHPRKCDRTGKSMISVFRPDCPYPVWHRDEWIRHAQPPSADFDPSRSFFDQAWELFQRCPIAHRTGAGNENAEYTDDTWYSKNAYLCHSMLECEDVRYSYRSYKEKDSLYCAFCSHCELCLDLTNCLHCFDTMYAVNCRNVQNSAFLYDCRNCTDCMFCCNLRNKKFCFGNQQLSQEQYEAKAREWDLRSRAKYEQGKQFFLQMMRSLAWHRAVQIDKCEQVTGNYLEAVRQMEHCFYISDESEECCHAIRGGFYVKSCSDIISCFKAELCYCTIGAQDQCYQVRFSCDTVECRFMDYCLYCFQCEHCFGCCGLVGKKYCIFNRQYTSEEYTRIREEIIEHMKVTPLRTTPTQALPGGMEQFEWGSFFPGYFAPNPYDESWAGFHFPLSSLDQEKNGFRTAEMVQRKPSGALSVDQIPDVYASGNFDGKVFWDEVAQRPFQIQAADIAFTQKMNCPLPYSYYMLRIQENFSWMPFDGALRKTTCAKSGREIETNWPSEYDGRIVSEEEYLKIVG